MSKNKYSPQDMLSALDAFVCGEDMDDDRKELAQSIVTAGCFASAAYDAHPIGGGECLSMVRAFLLAMVTPAHPELDYLRADPASGAVARKAAEDLHGLAVGD